MNNWQIIDDKGVIHSGSEAEMNIAWDIMVNHGDKENYIEEQCSHGEVESWQIQALHNLWELFKSDWEGDLKLIEIHKIHK